MIYSVFFMPPFAKVRSYCSHLSHFCQTGLLRRLQAICSGPLKAIVGFQTFLLGLILIKLLYGCFQLENQTVLTFKKLHKMILEKLLLGKEPGTPQQSR